MNTVEAALQFGSLRHKPWIHRYSKESSWHRSSEVEHWRSIANHLQSMLTGMDQGEGEVMSLRIAQDIKDSPPSTQYKVLELISTKEFGNRPDIGRDVLLLLWNYYLSPCETEKNNPEIINKRTEFSERSWMLEMPSSAIRDALDLFLVSQPPLVEYPELGNHFQRAVRNLATEDYNHIYNTYPGVVTQLNAVRREAISYV